MLDITIKKTLLKKKKKHQRNVLSIKLRLGMWYDVMVLVVQADNSVLRSKFSSQN